MNGTATQPPGDRSGRDAPGTLHWFGVVLILAPLITRATISLTTLPAWDLDPTVLTRPPPALGPAGSMLVDCLVLLGAGALLIAERAARRPVHPLWMAGVAVGGVVVALHGWWWQAMGSAAAHGTLGNQRIGVSWLAAAAAAIAVMHAARDRAVRRSIVGGLLGLVILLSLRGGQQVFVEHPAVMASFRENPEKSLTAHGWTPDSPMAQAYIRRLRQPEATGWFGLSNVYASFAAWGLATSTGWLIAALRGRRGGGDPRPRLNLAASVGALAASGAAVYLADSKGGIAFATLGLALVAAAAIAQTPRARMLSRLGALLGPGCILGVLTAVVVRGLVGERIGELSILFRWFYMQASLRIFGSHAATGVGPDGFQLAYLTAKNPLNPEEVSSPHSILLDWIATLGVAGLAWGAVLIAMSSALGRTLLRPAASTSADDRAPHTERLAIRTAMLSLAVATIAASWFETPYIPSDIAIVRLAGLGVGCAVALAFVRAPGGSWLEIGAAAGALAMLAHAQIELTGSAVAACGLFLVVLGAGAAPALSRVNNDAAGRHARWPAALGAASCVLASVLVLFRGVLPARAWETELTRAAEIVEPIPMIAESFAALDAPGRGQPPSAKDLDRLNRDISAALGHPVSVSPRNIVSVMIELDRTLLPGSAAILRSALARYPDEWRIGREASRLYLRLLAPVPADRRRSIPDLTPLAEADANRYRAACIEAIPTCVEPADPERARHNPPRTRALALVHETLARNDGGRGLEQAASLLAAAIADDPYNLDLAHRLFRLSRDLHRPDEARMWAVKALELDDQARLDREVRGLPSQDRRELEAAAGRSGAPAR